MSTAIPWRTSLPTLEAIAAHAAAHPIPGRGTPHGYWLKYLPSAQYVGPALAALAVIDGVVSWDWHRIEWEWVEDDEVVHWLPCTAQGVPVDFVALLATFAEEAARRRYIVCQLKALEAVVADARSEAGARPCLLDADAALDVVRGIIDGRKQSGFAEADRKRRLRDIKRSPSFAVHSLGLGWPGDRIRVEYPEPTEG